VQREQQIAHGKQIALRELCRESGFKGQFLSKKKKKPGSGGFFFQGKTKARQDHFS
jgi:hypothetical protein